MGRAVERLSRNGGQESASLRRRRGDVNDGCLHRHVKVLLGGAGTLAFWVGPDAGLGSKKSMNGQGRWPSKPTVQPHSSHLERH